MEVHKIVPEVEKVSQMLLLTFSQTAMLMLYL